jgi:uncharacterized protein
VNNSQKLSIDLKYVCLVLLAVIISMLAVWRPWSSSNDSSTKRTITVNGEAFIKSTPDSYMFYPSYQKKGTDRAAIQTELTTTINDVVAKLKALGVAEQDITLASSTYDNFYNDGTNEVTSNSLTINVDNKDLSQKVQDYLLTTAPTGQVSPSPSFSRSKRKSVENDARSQAIADAKQKAAKTASDLGAKLGKVVSITDQNMGSYPMPMAVSDAKGMGGAMMESQPSLPVLAGNQEIASTVQVVYEIK